MLEELERTGKPVRFEKEYIRKDRTRVPIELLAHRINDESGNLQFYYAFISNITERKLAEKALEERRNEIEIKTRNIEEANIALKVLLKKRDDDRSELK